MGEVRNIGRKRPNGEKIMQLRKEKGMNQADFACRAGTSERVLREIERRNHLVPATVITSIAAALEVSAGDITVSTPDAPPIKLVIAAGVAQGRTESLLKLRVVRSATELSALAERAHKYDWKLKIDPSEATASDMQAVLRIVKRIVHGRSFDHKSSDEFDKQEFGEIPRLARLSDLLTRLGANTVNVIAGVYTHSWLRNEPIEDWSDILDYSFTWVRDPKTNTQKIFLTELVLLVHFVPSDVEDEVVQIETGPSLEDFEHGKGGDLDDDIPF
jgi:transcriptional regulator with XRE-family HTH domain